MPVVHSQDPQLSKTFRFRDLCPELRNKVYEAVYEAQPPSTIDLSTLLKSLPPINLTLTSHQIHSEAQGYYLSALDRFWQTHTFTFTTSLPWPLFLGNLDEMYMRSSDLKYTTAMTALGHRVDQLAKLDMRICTISGTLTSSVVRFTLKEVKHYVVTPRDDGRALGRPRGVVAYSDEHVGMLDLVARWFVDYHYSDWGIG